MVGIKGFEMPENCRKCKIKVGICRVWEDAFALGNIQRPADCLLIEIEEIDQEKEIEKVKADLCKILDSYSTPRFIDASEMDVDKFKEEMSKAQLRVMPSEDKFDKFCQLYENWIDDKKLEVQYVDKRDTEYVYPSYISIDDVNHLIAIVRKGE